MCFIQEAKRNDAKLKAKEEYSEKVEKLKKGDEILSYRDIPWPCDGTIQEMVDVMLADAKITDPNAYRNILPIIIISLFPNVSRVFGMKCPPTHFIFGAVFPLYQNQVRRQIYI